MSNVIIIGASHGGVSCAFNLRKEGFDGSITLIDADPHLPYHRPPLSKSFLTDEAEIENYQLKSSEAYEKENIALKLGVSVLNIDRDKKEVVCSDSHLTYDKLILSTGADAFIPPIAGINDHDGIFPLRNAQDVLAIKAGVKNANKATIIGGGYIGLEIAASLKKLGLEVVILERESRLLSRVTSPDMSQYFLELHQKHEIDIQFNKEVKEISKDQSGLQVSCADGSTIKTDIIVLGVGIKVNQQLASDAGLKVGDGIEVDEFCRTTDPAIYAIGDCSWHFNPSYDRHLRLESVQNATDQGKTVAKHICGKDEPYNTIPWFWSDQYDVKLQMVGLSNGYDELICRIEQDESKRSYWYFKSGDLIAVDAVNNPKAYVLGTKFIKDQSKVNKGAIGDSAVDLKPGNLIS